MEDIEVVMEAFKYLYVVKEPLEEHMVVKEDKMEEEDYKFVNVVKGLVDYILHMEGNSIENHLH